MIFSLAFVVLGVAVALLGVGLLFNVRGMTTAWSQYTRDRAERMHRRLGGGLDMLGTPPRLSVTTSVTRFRLQGAVLAFAGLVMALAGSLLLDSAS
ncbi:hypothetical protein GCM10010218_55640 [Streptomyces mashuensis]|uniref:Uncharacterized protein n=1 Tax=Streptomyces mashuensis TaxID=33904 RepID=A0A919B8A7_9ACTN|nr:hypothetical protein [Streptomyces mashuensis]GHF67047.1 hypothetical protein GCM10010218_55640 [Streptomyces mashuensis]